MTIGLRKEATNQDQKTLCKGDKKLYQLSQRQSAGTIRTLLCDVIKYPSATWRLSMQHVRAVRLSYQVMWLRGR